MILPKSPRSIYRKWLENQLNFGYEDKDSIDFSRGYFVLASTPFIFLFLLIDLILKISINDGAPSILPWTIGIVCVILAMTPFFLKVTREIKLTSSIVNLCIFSSLYISVYLDPALLSFSHTYIPVALSFAVLSLGSRSASWYLVSTLIFSYFLHLKFVVKLANENLDLVQPIIATTYIDLPIMSLISFALVSVYDQHRTNREKANRKLYQEEINKQENLSRNHRDKALIEMAGGIAHEINNPLFAISGTIEQSLRDPQIDSLHPMTKAKLLKVKKQSQRIHTLIDKLLQFTSAEDSHDSHIDAQLALTEALRLQQSNLQQNNIAVETKGDSSNLNIDIFSLMKIFNCLIANAIYECRTKDFTKNWIHIHFSANESFGYIDIIDPGFGIQPEIAKKLFQPFFTTKDIGEGSGLGLSEALGIAKAFKGDLQYLVNNGHTCFRLSLPLLT